MTANSWYSSDHTTVDLRLLRFFLVCSLYSLSSHFLFLASNNFVGLEVSEFPDTLPALVNGIRSASPDLHRGAAVETFVRAKTHID